MTDKERELAEKYLGFKLAEKMALMNACKVKKELKSLAPHKIGEIIKWREIKQKRVGGTPWNPIYEDIDCGEKYAVLKYVEAVVSEYDVDVFYRYEFGAITKDGGVSKNNTRPTDNYEWTGQIHKDYRSKEE